MYFPDEIDPDGPEMMECPSFKRLCPGADPKDGIYLQIAEATPDPRTIKTHLPLSLLHPSLLDTAKVTHSTKHLSECFKSLQPVEPTL